MRTLVLRLLGLFVLTTNQFYELLLWPEERAVAESQRADREQQDKESAQTLLEQERQRNQELLARLAALGIDPE